MVHALACQLIVACYDARKATSVPYKPRGCTPIKFGWGLVTGFAKVLPFTRLNFANFVTLYQTKSAQLFLISIFCEQSH